MVSDDEGEGNDSDHHPGDADPEGEESEVEELLWCQSVNTTFDNKGARINHTQGTRLVIIEEEKDKNPTNMAAVMLQCHHQFKHISFLKLQLMEKQGVIPKCLSKGPILVCSEWLYYKAIKS